MVGGVGEGNAAGLSVEEERRGSRARFAEKRDEECCHRRKTTTVGATSTMTASRWRPFRRSGVASSPHTARTFKRQYVCRAGARARARAPAGALACTSVWRLCKLHERTREARKIRETWVDSAARAPIRDRTQLNLPPRSSTSLRASAPVARRRPAPADNLRGRSRMAVKGRIRIR